MVTMQISVSESTAKLIEQAVRERQLAEPGEYIEELIEADHANDLDIDPEHKKWIMEQVREALESDPADDIEVTPEYWEKKRQQLEEMIANKGVLS